ncbi:hypothetical protein AB0M43_35435 [Longispora sp. NPDC051575]|uniref:hypothetical protein n=1 Tax=Longispora sp. NPDC051575 TaxID=3154943 RepID=UPI0034433232
MKRRASYPVAAGLFAVSVVFGLAVLMIVKGYGPEVITPVVTGTSLAAAELMRRVQVSVSTPSRSGDKARDDDESTDR